MSLKIPKPESTSSKLAALKAARSHVVAKLEQKRTERLHLIESERYHGTVEVAEIVPARVMGRDDRRVKLLPRTETPPPVLVTSTKTDREMRAKVREVLGDLADTLDPERPADRAISPQERIRELSKEIDVLEAASGKILAAMEVEHAAAAATIREQIKPDVDAAHERLVVKVLEFHAALSEHVAMLHELEAANVGFAGLRLLPIHHFGPTESRRGAFGEFMREARLAGFVREKDVPKKLLNY